jgi:hypothetical protein
MTMLIVHAGTPPAHATGTAKIAGIAFVGSSLRGTTGPTAFFAVGPFGFTREERVKRVVSDETIQSITCGPGLLRPHPELVEGRSQ